MLNQVVLVGRLTKEPKIVKAENGMKYSYITLAVPRSFKNAEGEYETDFIDCILWEGITMSTAEYCKKGDMVGIKGRVQNGTKKNTIEIVAEKVTFLSSKEKGE